MKNQMCCAPHPDNGSPGVSYFKPGQSFISGPVGMFCTLEKGHAGLHQLRRKWDGLPMGELQEWAWEEGDEGERKWSAMVYYEMPDPLKAMG